MEKAQHNDVRYPSFCIVKVDDLQCWINYVIRQSESVNQRLIFNQNEYCGRRWVYRGQADVSWNIESSFEREICWSSVSALANPERELRGKELASINAFKTRAWRYVQNPQMSNLEWLTLMRHHGVPTRLVDFSESAAIALYFALEDERETNFAIWAVDRDGLRDGYSQAQIGEEIPGAKEAFAKYGNKVGEMLQDDCITDPCIVAMRKAQSMWMQTDATVVMRTEKNRELASQILKGEVDSDLAMLKGLKSLYFYPEWPSPRMLAQRGLFMMATALSTPFMSALCQGLEISNYDNPLMVSMSDLELRHRDIGNAQLIKFEFAGSMRKLVRGVLDFANCRTEVLYPDIDGIAKGVGCELLQTLSNSINVGKMVSGGIQINKDAIVKLNELGK